MDSQIKKQNDPNRSSAVQDVLTFGLYIGHLQKHWILYFPGCNLKASWWHHRGYSFFQTSESSSRATEDNIYNYTVWTGWVVLYMTSKLMLKCKISGVPFQIEETSTSLECFHTSLHLSDSCSWSLFSLVWFYLQDIYEQL